MTVAVGTSSCSSSSRLAPAPRSRCHAGDVAARPVQAGDQASLDRIAADEKTIGMVVVAAFAASAAECCHVRRSRPPDGEPDRPPVPAADRIGPSAQRYSIATFRPST